MISKQQTKHVGNFTNNFFTIHSTSNDCNRRLSFIWRIATKLNREKPDVDACVDFKTNPKCKPSTNVNTGPIVKDFNVKSDSRDNELVATNSPVQTNKMNVNARSQTSKVRINSIIPKRELKDAKRPQAKAKVKQEKIDLCDQAVEVKNEKNNQKTSNSDDDSGADSTISSATEDAKTRQPFKADQVANEQFKAIQC